MRPGCNEAKARAKASSAEGSNDQEGQDQADDSGNCRRAQGRGGRAGAGLGCGACRRTWGMANATKPGEGSFTEDCLGQDAQLHEASASNCLPKALKPGYPR